MQKYGNQHDDNDDDDDEYTSPLKAIIAFK
jgi:hypothetical protein